MIGVGECVGELVGIFAARPDQCFSIGKVNNFSTAGDDGIGHPRRSGCGPERDTGRVGTWHDAETLAVREESRRNRLAALDCALEVARPGCGVLTSKVNAPVRLTQHIPEASDFTGTVDGIAAAK